MLLLAIFLVLVFADLILFTFYDKYVVSFVLWVGVLAGAWYLVPAVTDFVASTGLRTLLLVYLPSYLGIGVATATVKWLLHLFSVASSIRDLYKEFLTKLPALVPAELNMYGSEKDDFANLSDGQKFVKYVYRIAGSDDWRLNELISDNKLGNAKIATHDEMVEAFIPMAKRNVGRITFWALQWPITILGTIVEDILVKLGKHLSRLFDFLFTGLARKIVARAFRA